MTHRPYFPGSDLTDGGTIGQQVSIPVSSPEGYKQYSYQQMRDNFALALLEAIERCKHPVVVRISENEWSQGDGGIEPPRYTILEIRATLTPTRYHDLNVPRVTFLPIDPEPEPVKTFTWRERLKIIFTGKL